jgi:hypothetical protein
MATAKPRREVADNLIQPVAKLSIPYLSTICELECSVHSLPRALQREFDHVFPMYAKEDGIFALPTNQKALVDLVAIGEAVEAEKDRLLLVFETFARAICKEITDKGYWADFIDPCSGLPVLTANCNKVYSEVDGMEVLLRYKSHNAGFCKVLTHPEFGTAVYPATCFCIAPAEVVAAALAKFSN